MGAAVALAESHVCSGKLRSPMTDVWLTLIGVMTDVWFTLIGGGDVSGDVREFLECLQGVMIRLADRG